MDSPIEERRQSTRRDKRGQRAGLRFVSSCQNKNVAKLSIDGVSGQLYAVVSQPETENLRMSRSEYVGYNKASMLENTIECYRTLPSGFDACLA